MFKVFLSNLHCGCRMEFANEYVTHNLVNSIRKKHILIILCVPLNKMFPNNFSSSMCNVLCSWKISRLHTGEFTKMALDMSSQLFVMLYTLSIYPSEHTQTDETTQTLSMNSPVYRWAVDRKYILQILVINHVNI